LFELKLTALQRERLLVEPAGLVGAAIPLGQRLTLLSPRRHRMDDC
jgi:hypothetical protein